MGVLGDDGEGRVGGRAIDDDVLDVDADLAADGLEGVTDRRGAVVGGRDDGDRGDFGVAAFHGQSGLGNYETAAREVARKD